MIPVYAAQLFAAKADVSEFSKAQLLRMDYRDRGAPRGTTPPTPPGIRVRTMAVQIG